MLVVAFRSAALAVEQEAPVREGVVGETVGFPTSHVTTAGSQELQHLGVGRKINKSLWVGVSSSDTVFIVLVITITVDLREFVDDSVFADITRGVDVGVVVV